MDLSVSRLQVVQCGSAGLRAEAGRVLRTDFLTYERLIL